MIIIDCSHPPNPPKRFISEADSIILGRSMPGRPVDLDLTPDIQVSRHHARLTYENGTYWLEDLGSKHGTWLNGQLITTKTRLTPGDRVKVGQTTLTVSIETFAADETASEGILTSTVSAAESPSSLLLAEAPGEEVSLETARRQLAAFYELGAALGTMVAVEPLLKTVVEHLRKVIPGAQRGALLLQENQGLAIKAYAPEQDQPSVSLNLARLAIEKQEAFTWRFSVPGETGKLFDSVIRYGIQCAMYAPLIWQEEVLGVVLVDNFEVEDAFNDDDLRLLMAIANQAAMFVKNHTLQRDLQRQEVVRSNLLRQFSPKIAERLEYLLKERGRLQLGGKRADPVTILVSDVRGFTALSAQMMPDEVVRMLNELFGVCVPIIFEHDGTVDKYVGDAILVVFGSPEADNDQWEKAIRAALAMQQAIYNLGHTWQSRGLPVCQIGIGIHTGAVLHGFIGSPERMEYTVIGDTVNRTTRYCDGAETGEVVISKAVYEHVRHLVEAVPRIIETKHPETEPDLEAYVVKGLKANRV